MMYCVFLDEDESTGPSVMDIFYNILQKRCPMVLYIISNVLMTKSFLHKNIPSFIRNKRLFHLCSTRTINDIENEITTNNLANPKVTVQDDSDGDNGRFGTCSSDSDEDFHANEQHTSSSHPNNSTKSRKRKHSGGRFQKPRSLWDRWPIELHNLFTKATYLIGIMFNMKANGGVRSAASNLSLLLRIVNSEESQHLHN